MGVELYIFITIIMTVVMVVVMYMSVMEYHKNVEKEKSADEYIVKDLVEYEKIEDKQVTKF